MTAGLLEFGNVSLPYTTSEDEGVEIYSTPFNLYDGRTIVSGVSQTGKRPSFRGINKDRTFVTTIISEVGNRHNLTISDEGLGYGQITSFDYSYNRFDGSHKWYNWRLGFTLENLS